MPRSRRDKKVSLTQTKKKGALNKHKLIDEIRNCLDQYSSIFVFSYNNMRNDKFQDIRAEWKPEGRFFLGKNTLMAIALGRTEAEELGENLHLLSDKLIGERGLFMCKKSKEEVLKYFDNINCPGYAKSGNIASESVILPEGLLEQFDHTMEPQLRKLGLPTKLERGTPALYKSYTVCKEGEVLNPEQAKVLKLLGNQMASFQIRMEFYWDSEGAFEDLGRATLAKRKKVAGIKKTKKKKSKKAKSEIKESTCGSDGEDKEMENEDVEEMEEEEDDDE